MFTCKLNMHLHTWIIDNAIKIFNSMLPLFLPDRGALQMPYVLWSHTLAQMVNYAEL